MEFDYSKLRGKIREIFGTQDCFAAQMKMGRVSLSKRLNNSLEFSQSEIDAARRLMRISEEEIPAYFFTKKVQKHEPHEIT